MVQPTTQEIVTRLFQALEVAVSATNKRRSAEIAANTAARLYITLQTDIPGEYRIDVDYPTDERVIAIKNHYVVRLVIRQETGAIELTEGSLQRLPICFSRADYRTAMRTAGRLVLCH